MGSGCGLQREEQGLMSGRSIMSVGVACGGRGMRVSGCVNLFNYVFT